MRRLLFFLVLMLTPSVCFAQASVRTLAGVNAQTGTSYTITAVDQTKLLTFNNANPVAVTLPSPANTNFGVGAIFSVRNLGTGRVTITPTSSTVDGAATLILDQNQGADIYSDGTNYETQKGTGVGLFGSSDPTGSCVNGANYTTQATGKFWVCQAGVWVNVAGGGGGGSPSVGTNGSVQVSNGSGLFSSSGNVFDLNSLLSVNEEAAMKGPNPAGADIRAYGGFSFNPNIPPAAAGVTATCNGTTSISLSSASLFSNTGGIAIKGCGATNTMTTPSAPTVTTNEVQAGMGTGNVVAGLTGATPYNYKIVAQDLGMGYTAASPAGSVTTGPTSLGAQSVAITSCTRSNATVTCVTATQGLAVGAEIKIRGMSDSTFNGNWQTATVPDTTHFTYTGSIDSRNGSTTSATGGTVVYWPCNHITWSATTGAYRYLIYSDRGSPGTFNLIGISKPSYPSTIPGSGIGTDGSLYFDDFGTVTTYPTPPWTVPSTAPASATNDTLVTTIVSGAGTPNIVVANSASQTLSGTPARADNAPIIKAAAGNGIGTVLIPTNGNYVTNSILDLSQIQGVQINVLNVQQNWNETVIFGYKAGLHGSRPVMSAGGASSFCAGSYSQQEVTGMPGFHFAGNPFSSSSYIQVDGQSNGQTDLVVDGSGGENQGFEINNACLNAGASSGVDDMSMAMMVRPTPGQSGQFTSNGRLMIAGNQSNTNAETPLLYNSNTAQNKINELFVSARGPMFQASTAGSQVHIEWYYCQGCQTPLIGVTGPKTGGAGTLVISVHQLENDTSVSPILSGLNGLAGNISPYVNDFADALIFSSPGYSGVPAVYTTSNLGGQNLSSETTSSTTTGSGGAIDGIFSTNASTGAVTYANKNFNAALSSGTAYPIFVTGPVIAAPTVAPAAGGTLPSIPLFYEVTPVWPNGGTGPNSLVSASITPSGGNLSVTVTWTPLGTAAGCTGYYILRGTSAAFSGANITTTGGGFVSGCNTGTYTDSSAASNGAAPTITSGGPSMLLPGTKGINAPSIDLVNDVTLSTLGAGTAYTINLPANQPTSGNTFLSCTAANPANCSWAAGGAGFPWNQIGNPTGNFNPSMAGFTSVFSYTSALLNAFEWANTTVATVTTSQSSPQLSLCGNAWTGASSIDCLTIQHSPGNGVNAAITDTYGHSGASTGIVTSQFSGPLASGPPPAGQAGAVIIPQGSSNSTTASALTIQGASSITPYSIALPGTAPISASNFLSCSSATASICSWQNGFGVGNGASPVMGYYISSQCPAIAPDGFCFNTPGNTRADTTCTWTNASTTITCTDTPFVSSDVGKQVMGWNNCQTDSPITAFGGAIASGTTVFTISTFTDSNHVVLSGTPANTSGATPTCFVYGNPDDTAMASVAAAVSAQKTFCPKVFLAAGQYMITKPGIFQMPQPPGCASLPGIQNNPGGANTQYGNLDLPSGYEIEGRGPGTTIVHIANNFPNGASKITNASPGIASWMNIPVMGGWRDFQLTGDGQAGTCAGMTGGDNIIYTAVAAMQNITLTNYCSIPGNTTSSFYLTVGIYSDILGQYNKVNLSAFGGIGMHIGDTNGSITNAFQLSLENEGTESINVISSEPNRYSFACWGCYITGSMTMNTNHHSNGLGFINLGAGSTTKFYNSWLSECPGVGCNINSLNPTLIACNTAGTCNLTLDNTAMVLQAPGTNISTWGIDCESTHVCNISAINSRFTAGNSGLSLVSRNTTDKLTDLGGNILDIAQWSILGSQAPLSFVFDGGRLLTGACTGVATASSTLGLYSTLMNPTNTTTTCTTATLGAGYVAPRSGTLQGLFCNSSTTPVSIACTVIVNGSPSTITCTILPANPVTCADLTHSVAINQGDLITMKIVTGAAETGANIKSEVIFQ